jgi:hypothetical protein
MTLGINRSNPLRVQVSPWRLSPLGLSSELPVLLAPFPPSTEADLRRNTTALGRYQHQKWHCLCSNSTGQV